MTKTQKILSGILVTAGIATATVLSVNKKDTPVTITPQQFTTITAGSAKYATRNADGSVNYPNLVSGDTCYIDGTFGTYTYAYMGNKIFSPTVHIMPINGRVKMTSGFAFDNVNGVIVDGSGLSMTNGIFITGGNVGISCSHTGANMEFNNIEISKMSLSAIWIKDEQDCNNAYNYPNGFFHYNIHHNYFHNMNLDMLYIGSTDSYGTARSITCNGVTKRPRPGRTGDIWVHDNLFDSANRQVLQINGCDTLGAIVENNTMKHAGFGMEANQGVLCFMGQGTKNVTIRNNIFISSWQHCLWSYAYGQNNIYGNTFDSSGIAPNGTNYAENPIVISGVTNTSKANFNIHDNTMGSHTSDPAKNCVWVDNRGGNLALSGNTICTSGKVYNPQGVPYTNTCQVSGDSVIVTVSVTHDTLMSIHFDTAFGTKDTQIVYVSRPKIVTQNDGRYRVEVVFGVPKDSVIRYIIRLPYDSVFIVHNGATHDSSYKVPSGSAFIPEYGVLIAQQTVSQIEAKIDSAGIKMVRAPVFLMGNPVPNVFFAIAYSGINDPGKAITLTHAMLQLLR